MATFTAHPNPDNCSDLWCRSVRIGTAVQVVTPKLDWHCHDLDWVYYPESHRLVPGVGRTVWHAVTAQIENVFSKIIIIVGIRSSQAGRENRRCIDTIILINFIRPTRVRDNITRAHFPGFHKCSGFNVTHHRVAVIVLFCQNSSRANPRTRIKTKLINVF